ncbi:spore germination protein [Paenibacillus sp. FSL R5-0527]|uniref:spore germination protein n=1 Tax=Paenibacillus sp. FSL R5-0527 TaxID=2975321 RepID=UPI00097A41DA|nr:spore germination protein [Paenibacillus macerans]
MARPLEANVEYLKRTLSHFSDAVFKELDVGQTGFQVIIVYLSGIADVNAINEQIVKPLILAGLGNNKPALTPETLKEGLLQKTASPIATETGEFLNSCVLEVLSGKTCLLIEGTDEALIVETANFPARNVEEPATETLVRGPRQGFVEDMASNLAMIRRFVKDVSFKIDNYRVGKRSSRNLAILYIADIANPELVQDIKKRIESIDIDDVQDSGIVEQLIEETPWSPFPQLQATERSDKAVSALMSGRVVIMLDGTPFVLIAPMTFWMLAQSPEDYYERFPLGTFFRILRLMALFIATFLPSLYVSLVSFHPGLIPPDLIMSIVASRKGIPFPVFVEALIMEVSLELLREASLRLPKGIGQVIGIVGGLVIGEAAIEASIVSPFMVIIVGVTAISSFASPQYSGSIGIRLLRFPVMLVASVYGLYGVILSFIFLGAHMVRIKSFGVSYMAPLAPIRLSDQQDTWVRIPFRYFKKRSLTLKTQDETLSHRKRK